MYALPKVKNHHSNLDIFLIITEPLLNEFHVRLFSCLRGIECAYVLRELCKESADSLRRGALGVRMGCDHPGWPGCWHGSDLENTEIECPKESARQFSKRFRYEARTKRHSPLSLNGLVVNHSHMNALVLPSFTESIRPRMSLFTTNIDVRDKEEIRRIQVVSARSSGCLRWMVACTFEVNSLRVPALLESHYKCHGLAPALHKNVISEAVYLKSVEVPNTFRVSRCQQWSPLSHR